MTRKTRILYVLYTLGGGGSEMLTHRIIRGLSSAPFDFVVVGLMPFEPMAEAFRLAGARLYTLGHEGGLNPRLVWGLRNLIRLEHPDLIHSHHLAPLLYTRLALAFSLRRPPHIHTVHVLPELHQKHGAISPKALSLYHLLLKQAGHVVCVSQAERERLQQVPGLRPSHVTAIPNGVDMRQFEPAPPSDALRTELGIPPGALVIASVGAFRPQKNQIGLVEAFAQVIARRKDVVLLLVGGPSEDDSFMRATQKRVKELGLEGHVRFLGPRSDVPEILALTDVYVQPSLYEGLPLSVMEAMAMQRAVVATDVGGNNELVTDGQTGLLVPPGDSQTMGDAILRLLDDPLRRASLGAAARELVSKEHTESCMIGRYEMLYRMLAGG